MPYKGLAQAICQAVQSVLSCTKKAFATHFCSYNISNTIEISIWKSSQLLEPCVWDMTFYLIILYLLI